MVDLGFFALRAQVELLARAFNEQKSFIAPWNQNAPKCVLAGSPATLNVAEGDAFIFNNRVRHAGSANTSGSRRPLLYLVYGRDWYTEDLHRQLLEDGGFAEPGGRVESLY